MIRIITDSISDLSQQEGQAQDFRADWRYAAYNKQFV